MGDLTKNFSKYEYYCNCGKCMYSKPFEGDRQAIEPTAIQNQKLRNYINDQEQREQPFEVRLKVNSGIRCTAWNRHWKGKDHSRHLPRFFFKLQGAGDLSTTDISTWKLRKYTKEARKKGIIRGGVGLYRTFIHNDTSSDRFWGLWKFWAKP